MPEIPEPVEPRAQLGWALVIGGLAALFGTPIVYRLRAANSNVPLARNWLWPTWWMLVPLAVVIIGLVIARVPQSFDLRRSLLRSRLFAVARPLK